jgi:hypothetical protein
MATDLVRDLLAEPGRGRRGADPDPEVDAAGHHGGVDLGPGADLAPGDLGARELLEQAQPLASIVGCVARKNATLKDSGALPAARRLRDGRPLTRAAAPKVAVPMKTRRLEPSRRASLRTSSLPLG